VSGAVDFDPALARRLATGHAGSDWPVLPTQAGHDAGVLAAAGIPTAMLFVRNPTGVSHSPAEHAEVPDCLAGVDALAESLTRLVS
jgi:N-carbamoyl-L-amino-acid hydrolase